MPKPICSPARPPSESTKRHHIHHQHQQHNHHRLLKKSTTRGGGGQASPILWAKTKQMGSEITEPTSPKVTCAGQIKVRHKSTSSTATTSSKNWQSVMEEIERIHNNRKSKYRKRNNWIESFGFKKDVMQFLTCLRSIRLDFRCFGGFRQSDITTDDDEEDDEDEEEEQEEKDEYRENRVKRSSEWNESSRTVFSDWFMVLQDNQNGNELCKEERKEGKEEEEDHCINHSAPSVPPTNALLLMRSRSAPAKSWLEERDEEEQEEEEESKEVIKKGRNLKDLMDEEKSSAAAAYSKKENLVVMTYNTDFYNISADIAEETWVVGGIKDHLSRSRSWKR